jgi:hypothetical protein
MAATDGRCSNQERGHMMKDMEPEDEFAEFDTTEGQIDAMMATGEPVEVDVPVGLESLYVRVRASDHTWGGSTVTPQLTSVAPSVKIAGPVRVPSDAAA